MKSKREVTKKDLKRWYDTVIVLRNKTPLTYVNAFGYNAGVYGWNWDLYNFGNTAILEGYRNFPANSIYLPYEMEEVFREKAEKVLENRETGYEYKEQALNSIVNDIIAYCKD